MTPSTYSGVYLARSSARASKLSVFLVTYSSFNKFSATITLAMPFRRTVSVPILGRSQSDENGLNFVSWGSTTTSRAPLLLTARLMA